MDKVQGQPSKELLDAIRANNPIPKQPFVNTCVVRKYEQKTGPVINLTEGYLLPVRGESVVYRYVNQKLTILAPNDVDRLAKRYIDTHWSVGKSYNSEQRINYYSPTNGWAKDRLRTVVFAQGTGQLFQAEIAFADHVVSIGVFWLNNGLVKKLKKEKNVTEKLF